MTPELTHPSILLQTRVVVIPCQCCNLDFFDSEAKCTISTWYCRSRGRKHVKTIATRRYR